MYAEKGGFSEHYSTIEARSGLTGATGDLLRVGLNLGQLGDTTAAVEAKVRDRQPFGSSACERSRGSRGPRHFVGRNAPRRYAGVGASSRP